MVCLVIDFVVIDFLSSSQSFKSRQEWLLTSLQSLKCEIKEMG